jgi:hypothetical protein
MLLLYLNSSPASLSAFSSSTLEDSSPTSTKQLGEDHGLMALYLKGSLPLATNASAWDLTPFPQHHVMMLASLSTLWIPRESCTLSSPLGKIAVEMVQFGILFGKTMMSETFLPRVSILLQSV